MQIRSTEPNVLAASIQAVLPASHVAAAFHHLPARELAAIGHPVVGDGTYGGDRNPLRPGRPFLHAHALALTHPFTGERLEFSDPLPPELAAVLSRLGS